MRRAFLLINQDCRTAAGLIARGSDLALSPLERSGLALHLIGCRSCRRYRDQMRAVDELVAGTAQAADQVDTMPPPVRERIADRIGGSVR